ncbi:MAG: hypothetical protein FWD53_11910 [Phycisphaerales bacterium]|nr:hypothetical protein [Phycisphaerales bacterium]
MSRLLPIQPNLEHLKGEAKGLLKSHAKGNILACIVLRRLKRFAQASDSQILSATVTLTEAQFALAIEYGFKSWDELRRVVLGASSMESSDAPPGSQALRIPDSPAGKGGDTNRFAFARVFQMVLEYCGVACEYDTVAGDSGLAFILQADGGATPYGAEVKELDLGWWPLDDWGAMLRLDFLGRVYGIGLRRLAFVKDAYRLEVAVQAEHFCKHHRAAIVEAFQAERAVVAVENGKWLVTCLDDGTPPLLGQLSCEDVAAVKRLGQYPWTVVVPGEMFEPLDRIKADVQAITFAVSLHHDRFGDASFDCAVGSMRGKTSGKASFALWAAVLRDGGRCGPHYYSANVVWGMKVNRRSVSPYLRQMAARHGGGVASMLLTAAEIYESVLAKLGAADTSKEAFASANGREALASLIDDIAQTEAKAIDELQVAVQHMKVPR